MNLRYSQCFARKWKANRVQLLEIERKVGSLQTFLSLFLSSQRRHVSSIPTQDISIYNILHCVYLSFARRFCRSCLWQLYSNLHPSHLCWVFYLPQLWRLVLNLRNGYLNEFIKARPMEERLQSALARLENVERMYSILEDHWATRQEFGSWGDVRFHPSHFLDERCKEIVI